MKFMRQKISSFLQKLADSIAPEPDGKDRPLRAGDFHRRWDYPPQKSKEITLSFPRFENEENLSESEICISCHGCCNYVTVQIEPPRSKTLKDEYTWYLLHRNVDIFIDNDNVWQLLFKTPCEKLGIDGVCGIYESRPTLCRSYSADACSRTGSDHKFLFSNPDEMFDYLNSRKKKKSTNAFSHNERH